MTGKGMSGLALWIIVVGVAYYATAPIWYPVKLYRKWRSKDA